jgi:hypothetical protein
MSNRPEPDDVDLFVEGVELDARSAIETARTFEELKKRPDYPLEVGEAKRILDTLGINTCFVLSIHVVGPGAREILTYPRWLRLVDSSAGMGWHCDRHIFPLDLVCRLTSWAQGPVKSSHTHVGFARSIRVGANERRKGCIFGSSGRDARCMQPAGRRGAIVILRPCDQGLSVPGYEPAPRSGGIIFLCQSIRG